MAVDTSSAVRRQLAGWQRAVQIQDRDVGRQLGLRWARALAGIDQSLQGILAQIEREQAAGRRVPVSWLHERDRLRTLRRDLDKQLRSFSRDAHRIVRRQVGAPPEGAGATETMQRLRLANAGSADLDVGLGQLGPRGGQALLNATALSAPGGPVANLLDRIAAGTSEDAINALVLGVAAGKNPRLIARDLQPLLDVPRWRSLMIARTETLRAWREATGDAYRHHAHLLQGWVWLSAADKRTCPACWAKHGTVHEVYEVMGTHPNCRCAMAPLPSGMRPADLGIVDGEQAFARLPEADRRAILGPGRFDAYGQGLFRFQDMATPTNHPTWGPGVRSTPLRALAPSFQRPLPRSTARILQQAEPPPIAPVAPVSQVPDWADQPTVADAEARIRQAFPNADVDMGLPRITRPPSEAEEVFRLDSLNAIGRGLTRMAQAYPEPAARLRYIGTYADKDRAVTAIAGGPNAPGYSTSLAQSFVRRNSGFSKGRAFAHASNDGRVIAFNPHDTRTGYWRATASVQRNMDDGFLANGAPMHPLEAVAVHEYGHQVENWLDENGGGSDLVVTAMRDSHRAGAASISRYAKSHVRELFAEAFVLLNGGTAPAAAASFLAELSSWLDTRTRRIRGL